MGRRLAFTVVVGGVVYESGSVPPVEVAAAITNPDAWADPPAVEPEPAGSVQTLDGVVHDGVVPASAEQPEPPRSGRGSGEDAWRAHATHLGIQVPDDAGRDDIVALVDAHPADQ